MWPCVFKCWCDGDATCWPGLGGGPGDITCCGGPIGDETCCCPETEGGGVWGGGIGEGVCGGGGPMGEATGCGWEVPETWQSIGCVQQNDLQENWICKLTQYARSVTPQPTQYTRSVTPQPTQYARSITPQPSQLYFSFYELTVSFINNKNKGYIFKGAMKTTYINVPLCATHKQTSLKYLHGYMLYVCHSDKTIL